MRSEAEIITLANINEKKSMSERKLSANPLMVVFNFLITFAIQRAILKNIDTFTNTPDIILTTVVNALSLLITVIPFIQGSHAILDRMFGELSSGRLGDQIEYVAHYIFIVLEGITFIIAGEFVQNLRYFQDCILIAFGLDVVLNILSISLLGKRSLHAAEQRWVCINILFVAWLLGGLQFFEEGKLRAILLLLSCTARTGADFWATFSDRADNSIADENEISKPN